MESLVRYKDGVRFEVEARGHRIICDQPLDNGGTDAGMTPPEFLLASLATCAGFYAVQYLHTRKLDAAGLEVRVTAEKALGPARLASFRIEIEVPKLTDERHREGVLRAAKACLIHNTLLAPPQIELVVNAGAATLTAEGTLR
jgi:putative redox protein